MDDPLPWLTDAEVADLCEPLEQPAAQIRYLSRRGYHVERRPNGKPLLMRSELERVAGAGRLSANAADAGKQPDRAALLKIINGGKRGAQTQRR